MLRRKERLERRCGVTGLDLAGVVVAISRIPYGRPDVRTADGVLDGWRGTCSTKHLLLAAVVHDEWPGAEPELWHRPYRVTRELAARRWGDTVAAVVPAAGLVDVHTFATLRLDRPWVHVDVTFPLRSWDGRTDIEVACGPGESHPAGDDPMGTKAGLVAEHCDPTVREPFIAALGRPA